MLYQEDIMRYFYQISSDLREENIPVFNNIIFNYPGFPKKEDIMRDESEESDSDN